VGMALTYTLAGLQAVLDLVDTAITGQDWDGARAQIARANLILSGLPQSTADGAQAATMRNDLKAAAELVEKAQGAAGSSANSTRRTIRVGVRHQTNRDSRRIR
jgi:hypothetical protein